MKKLLDLRKTFLLNNSKVVCTHLLSEKYSLTHRCIIGFVIMAIGVLITKISFISHYEIVHYASDIVGYGIHGIGSVPFIHQITKFIKS